MTSTLIRRGRNTRMWGHSEKAPSASQEQRPQEKPNLPWSLYLDLRLLASRTVRNKLLFEPPICVFGYGSFSRLEHQTNINQKKEDFIDIYSKNILWGKNIFLGIEEYAT